MSDKVRSRSGWSYAASLALFALAFLLVAWGVRRAIPLPAASGMAEKFAYFEDHKDEYDVVFFGSSHVLCSIIPSSFEKALAERGRTIRAFNFGIPGMMSYETDYYLRRMLELEPARLGWVVCELSDWSLGPRYLIATDRTVAWRDAERTSTLIEAEWRRDLPLSKKVSDSLDHLAFFGRWVASTGEAQKLLALELGMRTVDPGLTYAQIDAGQGYEALEDTGNEGAAAAHARLLADPAAFEALIAALEPARAGPSELQPVHLPPLRRRLALFRGRDTELIQVIFATEEPETQLYLLARAERLPNVWAFNKPSEFPELYEIEDRYDLRHLNRSGAERFTRLLAERFAAHLAGETRGEGEQ